MAIDEKILALLERRGYQVTDAVRAALDEFIAAAEDASVRIDVNDVDEDALGGGDDDDELATTRQIACPHCGEDIAISIDLSGEDQDTIQDCQVCCSPIRVTYSVVDGRIGNFSAEAS